MDKLLLVFMFLLPFGSFFFKKVDMWHAMGQYVQVGILLLFSYSFFEKPLRVQPLNKPFGSFICWAGLVTSANWIISFSITQHYPVKIFMPFFNFICLILFYRIILEYLDSNKIEKILKYIKYSIMVMLGYCVLQFFSLDQFYRSIDLAVKSDTVVGTLGNSSHLAAFLAILQPVFFNKKLQDILCLILLWIVILMTGSASGLICGILSLIFWLSFKNKWCAIGVGVLSIAGLVIWYNICGNYFTDSGRFEIWQFVYKILKVRSITGSGLGSFGTAGIETSEHWQHLHNEYYQTTFELGFIGLLILVWCVWDYFKTFGVVINRLTLKLASIFVGFCLLGLFTFNAHIWLISIFGMFAYAGLYAVKNEVIT